MQEDVLVQDMPRSSSQLETAGFGLEDNVHAVPLNVSAKVCAGPILVL
jgi:hypothetical protein